ncbi:hypothetical protein [Bradyrhizobium sp.]|uniref:hypothetical protein n=1 Tax=Bradyrhizobium sp. TaxID=376 RepID=UPI003C5743BC
MKQAITALDEAALLAKNPQVDRDLLRDNVRKIAEAKKVLGKGRSEKPVVPPYGGRRMISDQAGKAKTRFGARRP